MTLNCFHSKKVVLFYFPFRWFSISAFILGILLIVILTHILVEKCNKYWSNEISDAEVVENQEAEDQHSFFDFYTAMISMFVVAFSLFIQFSVQQYLLSVRISLLLKDSTHTLVCMIGVPYFYFKNPLLRNYVWKKIMRISTVQPENNQIELQQIWTVLNKIYFISITKLTLLLSKTM